MDYKKFVRKFQIQIKNNLKIEMLKILKDQKILKNQIIQNIYMTKNRKKKLGYIQKNNPWL